MKRGLNNPVRPWAGGGAGVGQIRWFGAGELIPSGWSPCDGGAFARPLSHQALFAANKMSASRWASRFAGVYYFRQNGAGEGLGLWGRQSCIYRDLVVWTFKSGNSGRLNRAPASGNPNEGLPGDKNQNLVDRPSVAWSIDDDGYILVSTDNGELWGTHVSSTVSSYIDRLAGPGAGGAAIPLLVNHVRFKGRYFSATLTELRRCAGGVGAWATWTNITPAGMGRVLDLVAGQVGGVEVLAAFCVGGQVWVSSDGDAFTQLPTPVPNPIASQADGRPVYDGAGYWYSARGTAEGGFQVFRSPDLQVWTGVTHTVTGLRCISAGGGVVALGGSGALAGAYSADHGASWSAIITSALVPAYSSAPVESIATNGGYIVGFQADAGLTFNFTTTFELGRHRPRIRPISEGGVEFTAYMKVR